MITIIVCSVNPELAEMFRANCEATIGFDYELIIFDNRNTGYGICQVYNQCAQKAKGEYLCFVHEDVKINTLNWGKLITRKLDEPSCGIVGFAGAVIKSRTPSLWSQENPLYNMLHIYQTDLQTNERELHDNVYSKSRDFVNVVGVDGVFLMMRAQVWRECNFDENTFKAFHCYDLDISLQVAQRYSNYVCNLVELEHFSRGSFNGSWFRETIVLHDKWADKLPMSVIEVSDEDLAKNDLKNGYRFTKRLFKSALPRAERHRWLWKYLRETNSLDMRLTAIGKCIRYSLFRR